MQHHGWTLLFHECLIEKLLKLERACLRVMAQNPEATANANIKLFRALSRLILETIPRVPAVMLTAKAPPWDLAFRIGDGLREDAVSGCFFVLTPQPR